MKTVGMILVCGLTQQKPPLVSAAMTCPSSGGWSTTYNSKNYCMSTTAYKNYWSSETWCDAVGGKLVDMDNDCGTWTYGSSGCTALMLTGATSTSTTGASTSTPYAFTSTVQIAGRLNYSVRLSSGYVDYGRNSDYNRNYQLTNYIALCVEQQRSESEQRSDLCLVPRRPPTRVSFPPCALLQGNAPRSLIFCGWRY